MVNNHWVGADWNHGILYDFPIILGISSSQLTNIFQRGWLKPQPEFYDFPFRKGNVIIPSDELIFSRGAGWNHQPDSVFMV